MTDEELYNHYSPYLTHYDGEFIDTGFWGQWYVLTSDYDHNPLTGYLMNVNDAPPRMSSRVVMDTCKGLLTNLPSFGGANGEPEKTEFEGKPFDLIMVDVLEVPHNKIISFAQYLHKKLNTSPLEGSPFGVLLKVKWRT